MVSTLCLFVLCAIAPADVPLSHQATGAKVAEVTTDSALIWVRLTAHAERKHDGIVRRGKAGRQPDAHIDVNQLEGSCPGMPGKLRVRFGTSADLADARATEWVEVDQNTDFAHVFRLAGLKPATTYHFVSETVGQGDPTPDAPLRGSFTTAPPLEQSAKVTFVVITGQMYADADDPDGFLLYDAMARLKLAFIVPTGDNVYYDNDDPLANTVDLARYHWHRMYSYPKLIQFYLHVPGYWEKDDHDTYYNDCWPMLKVKEVLPLTYESGRRVFYEQVPGADNPPYRTFRWGKSLQVWLTEGRDFRSANRDPDGPNKTIWGKKQKEWLEPTLLASDAQWKILVSPTPIVGPDRGNKADNHCNKAFAHEGNAFRQWVHDRLPRNFFVACGDRHWQYHSVDPATGVQEFSCGPASDQHAGGSPGFEPKYHRFHRVKGGFLSVTVEPAGKDSRLTFRFHDVHGKVVYEYSPPSTATQAQ